METIRTKACPDPVCADTGKVDAGNIIRHASFIKTTGASQRCLRETCRATFSANTGTAYFGLRWNRDEFDQAVVVPFTARASGSVRSVTLMAA